MVNVIDGTNGFASQESPVAVVALANALLDISTTVKDDTLIHKYSLPFDGQIEVTGKQQEVFAEVLKHCQVEFVAGGSAQNTVRLVSRLSKKAESGDKRGRFFVVGKIGCDRMGEILQNLLIQDGVETRFVYDEVLPTGCCAALVRPDGTRCLAANIGAAKYFSTEDFERKEVSHLVDRAYILYVEGFFASHSLEPALKALVRSHMKSTGMVRVLSLSAVYICLESHAQLRKLLPYANVVVGNEDEFRALAALGSASIVDVARQIASVDYISSPHQQNRCHLLDFHQQEDGDWDWRRLDERLAVVTCGSSPTVCATSLESWTFPFDPLKPQDVKDTTGAGDAFLAGFLTGILSGRSLSSCVSTGHEIARKVITQIGCRLPPP